MDKRGLALKIIIIVIVFLAAISSLTAFINKKDNITGKLTSEIEKKVENVEEIAVGEEARQTESQDKIREVEDNSDSNKLAGNSTNNTSENETFYLQLLKNNITNNISINNNNT